MPGLQWLGILAGGTLGALAACKRSEPAEGEPSGVPASLEPAAGPKPSPPAPFVALPALTRPGRVLLEEKGPESRGLFQVSLDGTRTAVELKDGSLGAAPFDHGHTILVRSHGDKVWMVPVAGGDAVANDFHVEEYFLSVSDRGEAALFFEYDLERESLGAQIWNLRTGKGAGLPSRDVDLCLVAQQGDVSVDGSEAVLACVPCRCHRDATGCSSSLCRLRVEGHVGEEIRSGPGGHAQPAYAPDGRIVFASSMHDPSPTCKENPARCRVDLMSVPSDAPRREPTLLRIGAWGAKFSRVSGRMVHLAADQGGGLDCPQWPCTEVFVGVADGDGEHERRITAVETASLPRLPFSLDDQWIAFTAWKDKEPRGLACGIESGECVELGRGVVSGWVRAPGDATPPDPGQFYGCWQADFEAMRRTNTFPVPDHVSNYGKLVEGFGLRIGPSSVTTWLDLPGRGRQFTLRHPAVVTLHAPGTLYLKIDTPPGLTDEAPPDDRIPPLRIDSSLSKRVLWRNEDGRLHSHENFIIDALIGVDTGPLELRPTSCPSDVTE